MLKTRSPALEFISHDHPAPPPPAPAAPPFERSIKLAALVKPTFCLMKLYYACVPELHRTKALLLL